jgi:hypothetical protein
MLRFPNRHFTNTWRWISLPLSYIFVVSQFEIQLRCLTTGCPLGDSTAKPGGQRSTAKVCVIGG